MKKLVKLGTLLIVLFCGINVVHADRSCDDVVMYAQSDFWVKTGVYMNYAGYNYNYSLFTLKDSAGAAFSSYCRNAGIAAGKSYDGQMFKCKQVVFDTTTSNETRKTYDAGIVEILKNGYSTRNKNTLKLEKNQEYAATNLALRVYEMMWQEKIVNTNGSNTTGLNKAHQYYVNQFLDDSEIQSLLKQASGSVRSKFSGATTVTSWTLVSSGANVTNSVVNEAKRLVKLGLQAAVNYKKNGAATLTWNEDPVKTKAPVLGGSDDVTEYNMSLTYTFNVSKFKSSGAYIKMNFNCSNCNDFGINYKMTVNDKEVNSNTNLLSFLKNGEGTLTVKIEFTGDSTTYNCEELKYNLNVKYYDETISTEAYDMYSTSCSSNTTCQHFYMLYADDVEQEANIEDTIELCTLNCNDLQEQCATDGAGSEACQKFEEIYGSNCLECYANITNPPCSDTDSEIDLKEGYEIDTTTCTKPTDANILGCIINNEDASGNSYKATNLISNKYCSVWCKEDYHFVMPGNKEVNSGRYFSLQASIQGAKTCYTSAIDKAQFEVDLEAARKEMIDAYNNLKFYEAAASPTNLSYTSSGDVHYSHYYNCDPCPETGTCPSKSSRCSHCSGDTAPDYTNYKYEWTFSGYNYNGGALTDTSKLPTDSNTTCVAIAGGKIKCTYLSTGSSSCTHYSCSSSNGTDISYDSDDVTSAESVLKTKIGVKTTTYYSSTDEKIKPLKPLTTISMTGFNGILNNYNACSLWDMEYTFEPDIYFWYEESYMNDVITDKLETVGSTSKGEIETLRCSSDTDASYENCSTGWTSSLQFNKENKFVCSYEGGKFSCASTEIQINQTIRMKETIKAEGSYITPTQFYTIYPSGSIAVAEPGTDIENSSVLNNALPVGLGTSQGVYNYTLVVENLGEYYNNDKLGRIWGDEDSVVSTTLKEDSACQEKGALKPELTIDGTYYDKGVYVCAYKVNCPDCPVECDPDCENPDCPDNDCPVECDPPCIYTNDNSNISYRPITSEDINPNDRELGKNWKYDEKSISTALELKAYATTQEIETSGETIYDINFESPDADDGFAMKVVMDSKMINKIREYNDKHENKQGYANNTMKCYDHTNSNDGKTYKNVYCYSTFIDELLYDKDTKDNITITSNRIIGTDATSSDNLRKTKTQTSGYWTTWSEASSSTWTITTQQGLAYYKSNYAEIGIGPSWK